MQLFNSIGGSMEGKYKKGSRISQPINHSKGETQEILPQTFIIVFFSDLSQHNKMRVRPSKYKISE